MDIQPIVIGTAGHIDHGKSSLVKALTGVDPDRWEEERKRGMTIDLGFASLELPDGRKVGLVDVPGHERFVKNMVAGASGIDRVVLVVAADDGVMPQTREHLAIMEMLGVEKGLIALNKVDLVDEELVELAEDDIRQAVEGTFLEKADILRVSAIGGQGVEELRTAILNMATTAKPRTAGGVFRLPVQRVFSAKGVGTIVTGIPVSGTVKIGDVLEVLPGGQKGKVRGIQAYHEAAEEGRAGHSTALNLADVDHTKVERGCVAATPGYFQSLKMVGARLKALRDMDRPITNRMPVRVHVGTAEVLGEVILLESQEIKPGEEGMVQLRLESPLVCAPGDRFVLRLASPVSTMGGGVILEESRYRLKRFKTFIIDELERQAKSLGSTVALLEAHLARMPERWATVDELSTLLKRHAQETRGLLGTLASSGKVHEVGAARWIHNETLELSLDETRDALNAWFEENSQRARMDVRDLRSATRFDAAFLDVLLDRLEASGELIRQTGGMLVPKDRAVELDPASAAFLSDVKGAYAAARFQPPMPDEIAATLKKPEAEVKSMVQLLVDQGKLEHVSGALFIDGDAIAEARLAVTENCQANGQLVIPELRDRLGTTRKFLIPILERFDTEGLTRRMGNTRMLRQR
jgi:selenocysteine-specific elongation factor